MDKIFISKLIIIAALYFLTNYLYNMVDWHSSSKMVWKNPIAQNINRFFVKVFDSSLSDFFLLLAVIFWGVPMFYVFVILVYFVLPDGLNSNFNTQNYWEQIVLGFGVIGLCFLLRNYLDRRKIKTLERDTMIKEYEKTILELKRKIRVMEEEIKFMKN